MKDRKNEIAKWSMVIAQSLPIRALLLSPKRALAVNDVTDEVIARFADRVVVSVISRIGDVSER